MKRIFTLTLLLLSTWIMASAETVTIASQAEFDDFVARVNDGEYMLDAVLTTNVSTDQHIGLAFNRYAGTFNGKGNTITVTYNETTTNCVALFSYVNSATIANLTINGTISLSSGNYGEGKFSAAFIGESHGNTVLNNCISDVDLTFDGCINSDASYGAFIGKVRGCALISNCAAIGSVSSTSNSQVSGVGGFLGWNETGLGGVSIIDSYCTQTYSGLTTDNAGNNFARPKATIINSYYLNAVGDDDTQGIQKTVDEFTNGTVAALLGGAWKQEGENIVINNSAVDILNCLQSVEIVDQVASIKIIIPSYYIDGTDIINDVYVGVYNDNNEELVAPALQTKGAETILTVNNVPFKGGVFVLKFIVKDEANELSNTKMNVAFDNELKLSITEDQSTTLERGVSVTLYDDGGSAQTYTDENSKPFIINIPANDDVMLINGSQWMAPNDNVELISTDQDGNVSVKVLKGNWLTTNIDEIATNPGETLSVKLLASDDGQVRGGFELDIVLASKLTVSSNGIEKGYVTIDGEQLSYTYFASNSKKGCQIEAVAESEDYVFERWNDGNTDNPRTITSINDCSYEARFVLNEDIKLNPKLESDIVCTEKNYDYTSFSWTNPSVCKDGSQITAELNADVKLGDELVTSLKNINKGEVQNYTLNGIEINGSDVLTIIFNYTDSENNEQATADSLAFDYFSTNYNMVANINDTLNLFSGFTYKFYDTGGKNGNYSDNEYNQLIVNAPKGKLVQAIFNLYDIEGDVYDFLKIIDGTDVYSEDNLLDVLEFTDSEASLVYTATETNGGALNFVFKSDYSDTQSGWEATLTTININYTITYNLDNGTNDDSNPETYTIESETITLADASREGFIFEGWYDAETEGNQVTEIIQGNMGNVELWARWSENVNTGITDATSAPFTRIQNTLYFATPTDMAVYSVSGVMLYNGKVTEYTLPSIAGVYIIRTDAGVYKVMGE